MIAVALTTVAGEAFIPGSAAYMTATQTGEIISLYYLYSGKILSPKAALAILPVFAAEAGRTTIFLWTTSFLPPTGVVNMAAASIAVGVTLAMLATVNFILESGAQLEQEDLLKSQFRTYRKQTETVLRELGSADVKDLPSWKEIVGKFVLIGGGCSLDKSHS